MTQLYLVTFQRRLEGHLDIGRCVVAGDSPDEATARLAYALEFKPEAATYEVQKLKPQLYQVDRWEAPLPPSSWMGELQSRFPDPPPERSGFKSDFQIAIYAAVAAHTDASAIKRLAHFLLARLSKQGARDTGISGFDLTIDKVTNFGNELKQPHIAKQAVLTEHRFFSGSHKGVTNR